MAEPGQRGVALHGMVRRVLEDLELHAGVALLSAEGMRKWLLEMRRYRGIDRDTVGEHLLAVANELWDTHDPGATGAIWQLAELSSAMLGAGRVLDAIDRTAIDRRAAACFLGLVPAAARGAR